jgi:hypothetical protein
MKEILGFPRYFIEEDGTVIGPRGIRKPTLKNNGYLYLTVHNKALGKTLNITIHRAVAVAFIPNPHNLPTVNHKDGIKLHCHKDNLEWATHSEQLYHSVRVLGNKNALENRTALYLNGKEVFRGSLQEVGGYLQCSAQYLGRLLLQGKDRYRNYTLVKLGTNKVK